MRIIGLTGGIASGKSTVSAIFRELGAPIIDADEIAREVVEPGAPALAEISRRFPNVVGRDGRLDRRKLAEQIFADLSERAALNAILHPRIQQIFLEMARALEADGADLVIYDAALLIENQLHERMDGVIVVTTTPELQLAHLMERDALSREQAEARLAAQMPLAEKVRHARWVIDNSRDLASTRSQVLDVWRSIRGNR